MRPVIGIEMDPRRRLFSVGLGGWTVSRPIEAVHCRAESEACPYRVRVVLVQQLEDGLRLLPVGGVGGALTQRQQFHLNAAEFRQRDAAHLAGSGLPALPLIDVHHIGRNACHTLN